MESSMHLYANAKILYSTGFFILSSFESIKRVA